MGARDDTAVYRFVVAVTVAVVVGGVVSAAVAGLAVGPAAAASLGSGTPTELTSCTTIDQPGRYVIGADVRASVSEPCIEIAASDVVLDGRDHAVSGSANGTGIGVAPDAGRVRNVSVVDVTVRSWHTGVRLAAVTDATLRGVNASSNVVGVRVEDASAVTLGGSTLAHNVRDGVFAVDSTGVEIRDSTIEANGVFGVDFSRVRGSTLGGNNVSGNGFIGVRLARSVDNRLVDNRVRDNQNVGIELHTRSHRNVLQGNTVTGHRWDGLRLGRTSGNLVAANEIRDNRIRGVGLFNTSDGRLVDNRVASNGRAGVEVRDSSNVSLAGNDVRGNGHLDGDLPGYYSWDYTFDGGVHLRRSDGTRLVGTDLANNTAGVEVYEADDVTIRGALSVADGIALVRSDGTTVTNSLLRGSVRLINADENRITNNSIVGGSIGVESGARATALSPYIGSNRNYVADNLVVGDRPDSEWEGFYMIDGTGNAVVDNEIRGYGTGVWVRENEAGVSDFTFEGNVVRNNVDAGIRLGYLGHALTIGENRVADNGVGVEVTSGWVTLSGIVVRGNDRAGVLVERVGRMRVSGARIVDNGGDGITVRGAGSTLGGITVRDSTLLRNRNGVHVGRGASADSVLVTGSTLTRNREFGVANANEWAVDATGNYWGAPNGPRSDESDPDAPYADPVTGDLADGVGDAVSEDPTEPGASNVRFDPYLTASPGDVPASSDGSSIANSSVRANGTGRSSAAKHLTTPRRVP